MEKICFTSTDADLSNRIDRWLSQQLADDNYSRSQIKALIQAGHLYADDNQLKDPSAQVKTGICYCLTIPEATKAEPEPENIALDILYEDEHLIIINKAAGMVVHPAPGSYSGTLVNALLYHCGDSLTGIGGVMRPGIVHRLDKDTSGVMVVAKTQASHISLSEMFAAHDLKRRYQAVTWGIITPASGHIDAPIGRHKTDRKKQAVMPSGKPAQTDYHLIRHLPPYASLVECQLHTGRTHQIRVHLNSIGFGLIGDPAYGRPMRLSQMPDQPSRELLSRLRQFPRQALCATHLGFKHPVSSKFMEFTIPLPDDMTALIADISTTIELRGSQAR